MKYAISSFSLASTLFVTSCAGADRMAGKNITLNMDIGPKMQPKNVQVFLANDPKERLVRDNSYSSDYDDVSPVGQEYPMISRCITNISEFFYKKHEVRNLSEGDTLELKNKSNDNIIYVAYVGNKLYECTNDWSQMQSDSSLGSSKNISKDDEGFIVLPNASTIIFKTKYFDHESYFIKYNKGINIKDLSSDYELLSIRNVEDGIKYKICSKYILRKYTFIKVLFLLIFLFFGYKVVEKIKSKTKKKINENSQSKHYRYNDNCNNHNKKI